MTGNFATRSYTLMILVMVFLFACPAFGQEEQGNDFRFVFMTDIHVMPERNAAEGFDRAITKVNALEPDFVITGGDLVFDALEVSQERAEELYHLYRVLCGNFKMPVYDSIGNHEVFGLYEKSGVSSEHPQYGKALFEGRLGKGHTCRSFDHQGWHFILLDSIGFTPERKYIGKVEERELAWLVQDLEKVDQDTPIVVCVHIPLISVQAQIGEGSQAAMQPNLAVTNSKEVLDLFKDRKLKAVLQGHLHIVEEIIYKDTHYITGGAVSGAWWKGDYRGFAPGFVVVDVQDGVFTWRYETYDWQVAPAAK